MCLFLLLVAGPTDGLGAEDYGRREASEYRLRLVGPLAWPYLLQKERSPSVEVRERVYRLLAPCRQWCEKFQAAAILAGCDYHLDTVFNDDQLRMRIHQLAVASGCTPFETGYLRASSDNWTWWTNFLPIVMFAGSLAQCQRKTADSFRNER
jgi:hypothetical protein